MSHQRAYTFLGFSIVLWLLYQPKVSAQNPMRLRPYTHSHPAIQHGSSPIDTGGSFTPNGYPNSNSSQWVHIPNGNPSSPLIPSIQSPRLMEESTYHSSQETMESGSFGLRDTYNFNPYEGHEFFDYSIFE